MKINRYFPSFFFPFASGAFCVIAAFCVFCVPLRSGTASATVEKPVALQELDVSNWPDDGFPLIERRDGAALDEIWRALEASENASKIAPFATAVDLQLRRQGPSYRGKTLALRGRLLRAVFVPSSGVGESFDKKNAEQTAETPGDRVGYFDLWILLPDSKRNPVRLLTRRAPKGFVPDARLENSAPYPRDVEYRRETVEAFAVYYRTTAFDAGDDFFAAPTLVALDFQTPSAADSTSQRSENEAVRNASGLKIAAVLGLVAIWVAVRTFASRKKRSKRAEKMRLSKKFSDLPDSIEPFLVAALCFGAIEATPIQATDAPPTQNASPTTDADFWAAAFGKDVASWLVETSSERSRLGAAFDDASDSGAAERRETALLAFDRLARIVSPSVLKERFGTEPLGDFVATEPEKRSDFAPETTFRPFCGTLRAVETLPTSADEAERFGVSAIFRADVELDSNERIVVYSPFLPKFSAPNGFFDDLKRAPFVFNAERAAQKNAGIGERVAFWGLKFGEEAAETASRPVALTSRIGWFPVDSALGRRGVDLSTFEEIPVFPIRALELERDSSQKKAVARSLRWTSSDRAPFYESLAAVRRVGAFSGNPSEKTSFESNIESDKKKNLTSKKKTETVPETVVALFNRPEKNQGRAVRLRGWVRRVNTILIDDSDVRAATGLDRYFQLYLFANDSQGWPLVLCVPELPDGLECGGGRNFRREIEFSGFFYKTWAYRTAQKKTLESDQTDVGTENDDEKEVAKANWARVPLLIGRVSTVYPEENETERAPFSPTFLTGAFAVLAAAWVVVRFWIRRRR